ncbi:PXA domain-containing protein [Xylaria sp. CBS 124048]|nr:PXA domain-containing protein [Xylaria sp. CBS 124048]
METLSRCAVSKTCRRCLRSSLPSSPYSCATRSFSQPIAGTRRLSSNRSSTTVPPPSKQPTANAPNSNSTPARRVLRPDDLFHSFTNSPIPEIRQRAAFIRQHAYCPHPDHRPTRSPANPQRSVSTGDASPAHADFECPDCGVPLYCSEQHWAEDYEAHLKICDILRQTNEDDHDLRSGRLFPEFDYAGPQMDEAVVNMTNWDTFLYTREFDAINDDRSMRQATRLLTYPLTIGSVIHELSPYSIRDGGRLTPEGLKSLSALRYTLHPPKSGGGTDVKGLRPEAPPVRLFILGARAESSLPRNAWIQLAHLFPRGKFHIIFIGPESMANRDDEFPLPPRTATNPFGAVVEDRVWPSMKISTIVDYYHTLHKTGHFYPYDPYFDCFIMFHPGLGHPASSHEWSETVPLLLETKAPIIVTGYTQQDMDADVAWVEKTCHGEFDMLMEPGENIFRSLRWDINDLDPQDLSCGNWGVWAFRGKRVSGTPPTSSKAPTASNTPSEEEEESGAIATTDKDPSISASSRRRPVRRPTSAEFLTDKATAALIRRTLCARQLADRGRNSPAPIQDLLPPLTSRNDVDLQLYALISIVIRDFVQNWYNRITPDETFVAEIVQVIAHCTRALEQRLRHVDLESLLFDELPELLVAHVRAYRIATSPATRPPLQTDLHEIYHSLCPLPALSPVPRPGDQASVQTQADHESAYRQLLVQGVLAVLLPTEDLENEGMTSLVGQLLSELVIGNLVVRKLSEPWLVWEIIIMITRLIRKDNISENSNCASQKPVTVQDSYAGRNLAGEHKRPWSLRQTFWSFVHWIFLIVGMIRLTISVVALSWSLPPRSYMGVGRPAKATNRDKDHKGPPSLYESSVDASTQSARVPLIDLHIWRCVGEILEVQMRMPWLQGTLSMLQWATLKGPGAFNGTLDR